MRKWILLALALGTVEMLKRHSAGMKLGWLRKPEPAPPAPVPAPNPPDDAN
jgi:hypothetical protein